MAQQAIELDDLSHAIGTIYDCAVDPQHWPRAIESIARLIDITAFGIADAAEFDARVDIAGAGADTLVTIDGDPAQAIRLTGIGNAGTVTVDDFRFV